MAVLEFYFSGIVGILLFILSLAFYFMPTIIALVSKKRNALAIFLLNFFLGWTFIGWVVALVWSVTKD
jgi:hypothetical protein